MSELDLADLFFVGGLMTFERPTGDNSDQSNDWHRGPEERQQIPIELRQFCHDEHIFVECHSRWCIDGDQTEGNEDCRHRRRRERSLAKGPHIALAGPGTDPEHRRKGHGQKHHRQTAEEARLRRECGRRHGDGCNRSQQHSQRKRGALHERIIPQHLTNYVSWLMAGATNIDAA